jgi:D-arabinose 1-dehydrogenase-like Zn-dependent alcohol dehydrogenase
MFWNGYHVHSTLVASRHAHDDMLNFAARFGIKPTVQLYERSVESINDIFEKLDSNQIRYRAVLVAEK